ncbi:MAG: hypothetical protein M0P01_06570 [Treponema sp.]|nr:hypothetical protein [Treponema sp.]
MNMKKKFICATVFFIVLSCVMTGCAKKTGGEIMFDNSEPLALAPDVSWSVVLDPYAGYRKLPSWNSAVTSYCRKGDILQVLGETAVKGSGNWYEFKNGWLPETAVTVYNNRLKAETAASKLNK